MTFTINSTDIPLNEITIHFCKNNEKCKQIQIVKSMRYLGTTFDMHLR